MNVLENKRKTLKCHLEHKRLYTVHSRLSLFYTLYLSNLKVLKCLFLTDPVCMSLCNAASHVLQMSHFYAKMKNECPYGIAIQISQ